MQVILLDKIPRLGEIGDAVEVRPGYARNYLLPQKKAVRATEEHLAYYKAHRAELEKGVEEQRQVAQQRAEELRKLELLTIAANMDENESLYGSVGPKEIIAAFKEADVEVGRHEVMLSDALRTAGEHKIMLRLHSDVELPFKVVIIPAESP
jgi:large subunit ribosomal protein L9